MDAVSDGASQASYVGRMWGLRYFLLSLVGMDLRTRYRRSIFGIGWSLIRPIGMTAVFCLVFCRLFKMDVGEYAPYLLCGFTLWQLITESALGGCYCFILSGGYIRQQPVPLALFPLRVVLSAGIHAGIAFLLVFALVGYTRGLPGPEAFLGLMVGFLMLFIFCWAFALIAGLVHTHFPDTNHLLEILLQITFYLTPIIYPAEMVRGRARFEFAIDTNPFTYLVEMIRMPILKGTLPPLHTYVVAGAFVLAVVGLAAFMLRRMERRLVFWL